jgi:hypothetical protein
MYQTFYQMISDCIVTKSLFNNKISFIKFKDLDAL